MEVKLCWFFNWIWVLLLMIVVFSLSLFSSSLSILLSNPIKDYDNQGYDFKYLRVDYLRNESIFGIVSSDNNFLEDNYLSYEDENGNQNLISRFGTYEYRCIGICVCDGNDRRLSRSISRRLFHLVAATSSILAYERAMDHFNRECTDTEFDEEYRSCHVVSSNVDSCEKIEKGNRKVREGGMENVEIRRYLCKGNCVVSGDLKSERCKFYTTFFQTPQDSPFKTARIEAKDFGCERLDLKGSIEFELRDDNYETKSKRRILHFNTHARMLFIKEKLTSFCVENSRGGGYWYEYPKGSPRRWKRVQLCVAVKRDGFNPSVHCRQTSPEYSTYSGERNQKYW